MLPALSMGFNQFAVCSFDIMLISLLSTANCLLKTAN